MLNFPNNILDDPKALHLALELSMWGIINDNNNDNYDNNNYEAETRTKKSQNTTECVPVPSSEHVAEIVGRQGCKIKALRAKTNTYIKTPVRGEEPVFVVTGRKEDVAAAKKEILSAADHFSQIRAQRKGTINGVGIGPNSNIPGQVTVQVRVPYRVVGLVVGPKGATIKRIQLMTSTYIITPSRDKEPVFEVTGLPDHVEKARAEIESHIALRTGSTLDSTTGVSSGSESESSSQHSRDYSSPLLNSLLSSMNLNSDLGALYKSISNSQNSNSSGSDFFSTFSNSRDEETNLLNAANSSFIPTNRAPTADLFTAFGLNINNIINENLVPMSIMD